MHATQGIFLIEEDKGCIFELYEFLKLKTMKTTLHVTIQGIWIFNDNGN